MTRYEARIEKNWESHGLAHLVVARVRADQSADLAVFLVDTLCLGVKDAYCESDIPASALDDYLAHNLPPENESIHPACAKKLIEGAVAYAQSYGFAPHRDFKKARKVLSGLDAAVCPRDFTFGRDGRPCYVRGPDDTDDRVDRVLAILTARCGEDGYDYVDPEADDEAEPDAREALLAFLDAEPPAVPRFYELSGLITALLLCPTTVSPLKIHDALWPHNDKIWADADEAQAFASLLMAYWNQLNDLVHASCQPGAHPDEQVLDVWEEDFPDEEIGGVALAAATMEWARGFLRATTLWPEAWGDALTRPDLAPHWEVVGWWAHFERKENRDRMVAAAEAGRPRKLNPSVKALARALRPPFAPDASSN